MTNSDERIASLEADVAMLIARNELLTSFLMAAIAELSKDAIRETLRSGFERKIWVANKSMQIEASHDLQNLLRAFDVAMTARGSIG